MGALAQSTFERTKETMDSNFDVLAEKNPFLFMFITGITPNDYKRTRKLRTEYEDKKESLKQYKRQIREYSGRVSAFSAEALQTAPRLPELDWENSTAKIKRFDSQVVDVKKDHLPQASDTGKEEAQNIAVGLFIEFRERALNEIPVDEPDRFGLASIAALGCVTANNVGLIGRITGWSQEQIERQINRFNEIMMQATTTSTSPGRVPHPAKLISTRASWASSVGKGSEANRDQENRGLSPTMKASERPSAKQVAAELNWSKSKVYRAFKNGTIVAWSDALNKSQRKRWVTSTKALDEFIQSMEEGD